MFFYHSLFLSLVYEFFTCHKVTKMCCTISTIIVLFELTLSYWYEVKVYLFIIHANVQLFQDHFLADDLSLLTHGASVVVVQSLSHVQFFVTSWTAAHQASLFFTISRSWLKLMYIESVMLSNYLNLCLPLLLLSSIFHVLSMSESWHPMFLSFKILKGAKLKLKESYQSVKILSYFPTSKFFKSSQLKICRKEPLGCISFLK